MNQQFGRYRIEKELGRGAMGVVYQAFDTVLERQVAIKTIASTIRDENLRERFIREARAAGKLLHPNIITIYDFGVHENQLFISMEFVPGTDLLDLINSRPELDVGQKLNIVRQICLGLDFAHAHGVFHRDVKPANIRLDQKQQVKVVDFGLAVIQTSSLTRSNAILGTPSYIAPERLLGGGSDARSDQFAVGIILFELLTYRKAFKGDNLSLVIHNILHSAPPRLEGPLVERYPEANEILERAIHKNPAQRFDSMADMAEALDDLRNRMAHDGFSLKEPVSVDSRVQDGGMAEYQTEIATRGASSHTPKASGSPSRRPAGRYALFVLPLLIALFVAYVLFWSGPKEEPTGFLVFDVRPYARIDSIRDVHGDEALVLDGGPDLHITPLRISLAPGDYRIGFSHPDWGGVSRSVNVEIFSGRTTRVVEPGDEAFVEKALEQFALPEEFLSEED